MKKWKMGTLIGIGALVAGGTIFYFINKANKRKKIYATSVTPALAKQVITVVNSTQTPGYVG